MNVFTYNQYIKCIHTLRLNAVLQLAEEGEEYYIESNEKKHSHEKLVKDILNNKEEAKTFINNFLNPIKKIETNDLEIYNSNYITKKYKSKEADLIYKIKNKEIFFLIEYRSTIDYKIQYKMLNYCIDIMQEWSRNKKIGKNIGYPVIVPIVIYTGKEKWKISKKVKEKQISNYVLERYEINLEYNLIDINKYQKQNLLEQNTIFAYAMIIEKSKNKVELINNLNLIIQESKNKQSIEKVQHIINYLLSNVLENDMKQEILQKIDVKVP